MATTTQQVQQHKPWFIHAFELFYDGWNFAQFLSATVLSTWVSQMTGITWSTPIGPWLAVSAAFFVGIAIVRMARIAVRYVRVVLNRPHLVIEPESGGEKAMLEIGHQGAPITYSAVGRIVRTLDESATPQPQRTRFQCELQMAEGRPNAQQVTLKDGEWAHIVLADQVKSDNLQIRRGTFARRTQVADSGVEVEIAIRTYPSRPIGTVVKRIHITRDVSKAIKAVLVGDGAPPLSQPAH